MTIGIHLMLHYYIGDDYRPPLASFVRINAGRTSASFFISAMDDRILERDESFIILADPPSIPDGHSNCSATVTIIDTDGRSPFNSYKTFVISVLTKLSCIFVHHYKSF